MLLSCDRNGNVYQGVVERGSCRRPEMVMDGHLALGEYEEKKLKDLAALKKAQKEKNRANALLNREMGTRRRQYDQLRSENAFQNEQRRNQRRDSGRYLQSELMEEALSQPPMGFDYSPTIGNPLIGFGAQGEIITDTELKGESWGEVNESENFGNTILTAAMLPESYMMDETMGFSLNPFKAIGSIAKATIKIGGIIYDVGSSAARTALRVVDKQITGGKISGIIDDADATIKNIRETTYERVDDIARNADLTTKGILGSALTEVKGISQGKIGTGVVQLGKTAVGTVSRTYEDTKEAWFDTKEASEETATGRLLLKTVSEVQQKTDPSWHISQTHKMLSKDGLNIPLVSEVYQGVDLYSGGLLTRSVSGVSMPGKLLRGNAGLQLTDERVSKAEFIQNMVFYTQVAMTVVTFGAAGAVLIIIAQSMKNGPLGATKEGQAIFTLVEIAAIGSSGGSATIGSVTADYISREVQRKLAGEASKKIATAAGMGDTSQAMLQAALLSGSYKEASIAAGRVFANDVVVSEVSKKTGTTGGLLTSMALEATWATAGAPNENAEGQTPDKSEIFYQSMKQQVIGESQKRAIGMAATQAQERVGGKAGTVLSIGAEELIMSATDKGDYSDVIKDRLKYRAKEESIVAGKVVVREKIKGPAGTILAEGGEIAVRAETDTPVEYAPGSGGKGVTSGTSQDTYTTNLQKLANKKITQQAAEVARKQVQKQAMKTLPKSQIDMLVNAGEIGYSAYESDQSFSTSLQTALKEKTYDKVLIMTDKKQNELIKRQRQKVDEVTNKVIDAKEKAAKINENSALELQQKAQAQAEDQALRAQKDALDEIAAIENQLYDLQVARDHALEQASLAPQYMQDQLEENANALQVKLAAIPGAIKTKAEREADAIKLRAKRAEEMVIRNKKRFDQFNATSALGEAIAKIGKEAKRLREKASSLPAMDAEELLRKAIALEMQMLEMYMRLQAMENMAMRMNYQANLYDAQAGLEIAAAQEGRYPPGLFQRYAGKYDYRHPIAIQGYFKRKTLPLQPSIKQIREVHA